MQSTQHAGHCLDRTANETQWTQLLRQLTRWREPEIVVRSEDQSEIASMGRSDWGQFAFGSGTLFACYLFGLATRPQLIIPAGHIFGIVVFCVFLGCLAKYLSDVDANAEAIRRKHEEYLEESRRANSPEEIDRRMRQEADRQKAFEEQRRQEAINVEQQAHAKWAKYHRALQIDELDKLSGIGFERLAKDLFDRLGFTDVSLTPASGDQGGDLTAFSPDGKRTVIQAKRWKGSVGNAAIQEVLGALLFYDAENAIVITNSRFTDSAIALAAKDSRIRLIDRAELSVMIQRAFPREIPAFDTAVYERHVRNWIPFS